ncbi:helix-turn-helix domain-containing protein [Marinifilum sp. D737]|uniref:helix-turn-helix domain-containing protein n=1 Tax=Marinifilum sp. D737 TaxID=2969628 RepID=UPI003FA3583F
MNYETILKRNERLKYLIQNKNTGTPEELAKKLNTSVSTVFRMVKALKNLGEPIVYSKIRKTYYYNNNM